MQPLYQEYGSIEQSTSFKLLAAFYHTGIISTIRHDDQVPPLGLFRLTLCCTGLCCAG